MNDPSAPLAEKTGVSSSSVTEVPVPSREILEEVRAAASALEYYAQLMLAPEKHGYIPHSQPHVLRSFREELRTLSKINTDLRRGTTKELG